MIPLFQSILPNTTPQGGNLPYWLLFISVVSIFNSLQTYQSKDLQLTKRVYENEANKANHKVPQVTGLSARTFGTWTLITSIVRFYGAYYLQNKQIYELVQFSFLVAGLHFISEWLVYKTCKLGKGFAGPLVVSSISTIWMYTQKDFYVN
ncbi:Erg28 like protein-domain-containing protein [Scheffersomyces coipomensis]|uniref:Erg28 like protein-domain-containing protein n=1 Tax=Scheffersomyces coipomensis TaxID=1788519 RepID=UPI00315D6380